MFKLPIPTRLTDYLGEAVVWTVIIYNWRKQNPVQMHVAVPKNQIYTLFNWLNFVAFECPASPSTPALDTI